MSDCCHARGMKDQTQRRNRVLCRIKL